MSDHRAQLSWRSGADRRHRVSFGGGVAIDASAASDYGGDPRLPNPEELLVGALSSCHLLTFLAICERKGLVVEAYDDDAVGTLGKNDQGRMAVLRCELRPRVRFAVEVAPAELARLHEQAHRGCFIAASVKTEVVVCTA